MDVSNIKEPTNEKTDQPIPSRWHEKSRVELFTFEADEFITEVGNVVISYDDQMKAWIRQKDGWWMHIVWEPSSRNPSLQISFVRMTDKALYYSIDQTNWVVHTMDLKYEP